MQQNSVTEWSSVCAWAGKEIEGLRAELETSGTGPDRTNVIRGEIKALKRLIALPVTVAQKAERLAAQKTILPPGY